MRQPEASLAFRTINHFHSLSPKFQNRRAKWRKREPPRKTGYIGTNSSPATNLGPPLGPFPAFSQATTVSPPGSVDSWTSYQTPYELTHFNLLSPAASPYGTFSGQYGTYVHESQIFPMRQHFEYGSPSRGGGGPMNGVGPGGNGVELDDPTAAGVHHKADHYLPMDDNNVCTDG